MMLNFRKTNYAIMSLKDYALLIIDTALKINLMILLIDTNAYSMQ